jgi:ATP-dependent Lhr-like helicase
MAFAMPGVASLLVETFPRANKHYLVCYPFEGRLAHQTLGMLLTRRLERARLRPLGFVANEYALAVWALGDVALRIRAGRAVARRAVRRRHAGRRPRSVARRIRADEAHVPQLRDHRRPDRAPLSRRGKTRRQVTISTDLIYDVLRSHQPDHVLLRAARADAATGLLDIVRRLGRNALAHQGANRA